MRLACYLLMPPAKNAAPPAAAAEPDPWAVGWAALMAPPNEKNPPRPLRAAAHTAMRPRRRARAVASP